MKVKVLTLYLFVLIGMHSAFGQDRALLMSNSSGNVNFTIPQGATNNFRTLSLWIKPSKIWDASMVNPMPIVVKDKFDINSVWGGRMLIYVDKGIVKWTIADNNVPISGYSISSNQSVWSADRWYHLAFVLHPTEGMKMYVNGILQSSTNPRTSLPPKPVEGADEPFVVGAWGKQKLYKLEAVIDEFRIWSGAKTETEIRNNMCVRLGCVNGLIAGYNFNNVISNGLSDVCGAFAVPFESTILSSKYIVSTAPLGDHSENLYASNFSGTSLTGVLVNDSVILNNINVNANDGIHLYFKTGIPAIQTGLPDSIQFAEGVIGVWSNDVSASYDARFVLDPATSDCAECTFLLSRDTQVDSFYFRNENLTSCGYVLTNQSDNGKGWREEYYAVHEFRFSPGLIDSVDICANGRYRLLSGFLSGANYRWDDGSTSFGRWISESGKYWVELDYRGCKASDTIYVSLDSVPEFEFDPIDTVICEGDTITITCPLGGVEYEWSTGDTTRSIDIYKKGIYTLTTTYGKCSDQNHITVQVIPKISVDLGPDSLMCLGQERRWRMNPSVGTYTWWDGSVSASNFVFNQPGTYWVEMRNACFVTSDTVTLDFMECDCRVDIPNTFTPNYDRINDETGVYTRCYFRDYEFIIMDRWGNRVFVSNDANERWDGTYHGENCSEGVYSYHLSYRRWTGPKEPIVRYGTMMLLR